MRDVEISVRGELLRLMPERAAYWPRTKTLFVADLHWGKAAALRWGGLPVPDGNLAADLQRLSGAVARSGAERLIVLGDLLHARLSQGERVRAQVGAWRAQHPALKLVLVRGNHDRTAGDPPSAWGFRVVDGPTPGPLFVLQHEPDPPTAPDAYALGGHLHPAMRLEGRGRQALKLPCFWFRENHGVLPAFSSMAGGATIYPGTDDQVFVVTESSVLRVDTGQDG